MNITFLEAVNFLSLVLALRRHEAGSSIRTNFHLDQHSLLRNRLELCGDIMLSQGLEWSIWYW